MIKEIRGFDHPIRQGSTNRSAGAGPNFITGLHFDMDHLCDNVTCYRVLTRRLTLQRRIPVIREYLALNSDEEVQVILHQYHTSTNPDTIQNCTGTGHVHPVNQKF